MCKKNDNNNLTSSHLVKDGRWRILKVIVGFDEETKAVSFTNDYVRETRLITSISVSIRNINLHR